MDSKSILAESDKPRVAILRMEGTNNEEEAFYSFRRSCADPEYVHINEISRGQIDLEDFSAIFIPGGFSAGDYVRAGAIFAARLRFSVMDKLVRFINSEKPVIGICNGFQVLAELGLIPDIDGRQDRVVTLAPNTSSRFECRYVYIRMTSRNRIFSARFSNGRPRQVPVAHAEGRVVASDMRIIDAIDESGQILFRYSNPDGTGCEYPWNPNGSVKDIAAITNSIGNVVGLMPHPERVYYNFQMMGDEKSDPNGTGRDFFDSVVDYIARK